VFHVEQDEALKQLLLESSREIGVTIETNQVQLFLSYLKQLKVWNQSFNLTAITKDDEIIIKHFIDSLAALKAVNIRPGSHILDVGAGAGFPGIPLKIVRPDLCMTLIEPVRKKSAFLHFIVGLLRLKSVEVFQGTMELFSSTRPATTMFDYVTTRALTPSVIFQKSHKLLKNCGKAIIYSARPLDKSSLPSDWNLDGDYTFELPNAHGSRTISTLSYLGNFSSLAVPRGT
jgi:16S rRNA (guanine527-N7)-methyltransferase